MNNKNIVFNSNIKFKYYFKLNHEVKKVVIKYYDLLDLLELRNKKDNKIITILMAIATNYSKYNKHY